MKKINFRQATRFLIAFVLAATSLGSSVAPASAALISITSLSPSIGNFGGTVTMTGVNLQNATYIAIYYFSPTYGQYDIEQADFISQSSTSITFVLPAINVFSADGTPGNLTAVSGATFNIQAANRGFTDSFAPSSFVIRSLPVATATALAPEPVQKSKIVEMTPTTAAAGDSVSIIATGSFVEKITAIAINGNSLPLGSWVQNNSTVTFSISPSASGAYSVQIYNGSVPVLTSQTLTVSSAPMASKSSPSNRQKNIYIRCINGAKKRVAFGINPICPTGYAKQ